MRSLSRFRPTPAYGGTRGSPRRRESSPQGFNSLRPPSCPLASGTGRRSPVDCQLVQGLNGKRVVVTGGTSGIGEATSRRFLDEGARVVALAVGEDEVATAQERIPGLTAALRCDVADAAQVADAF